MRPVCTAAEARALDARLIEQIGVPGVALMDQASRGLAEVVRDRFAAEAARGVVVVCGSGNNGGDGYGAARWLRGWGVPVATWSLSEACTGDAAVMRRACVAAGVPATDRLGQAGLIVDAVFGTGLARPVSGALAGVLQRMHAHPAPVVAADLPSGLHADTGQVLGVAVQAAHTVTFGRLKRGLFTTPGADLAGEISCVDLGLDVVGAQAGAGLVEPADVARAWRARGAATHKGRSGRVLVIAGSAAMAGAAVLACRGALAGGAGLVTLLATRSCWPRLAALPPEVMVAAAPGEAVIELDDLPPLDRFDAVLIGPGLGGGARLPASLARGCAQLWTRCTLPALFDADALLPGLGVPAGPRVITPHAGEAARLLGGTAEAVESDRFGAVQALAAMGCVALLKGRHTLVAAPGEAVRVSRAGAPTLATGGSGDVLAGLTVALLARGWPAAEAAAAGAHLHARAGELLAARRREGWTASQIADVLPEAIEELPSPGALDFLDGPGRGA